MTNNPSSIARAALDQVFVSASHSLAPPRIRWRALSPPVVSRFVGVVDAVGIASADLLFYMCCVGTHEGWDRQMLVPYLCMTLLNIVLLLQSFSIAGLYRFDALVQPARQFRRIAMICIKWTLILAVVGAALDAFGAYLKVWTFAGVLLTIMILWLGRLFAFTAIHDLPIFTRRIMVYGAEEHSRPLLRELREKQEPWNDVLGVFDDRPRSDTEVEGYPVLGGSDELIELARKHDVDEVLVSIPWDRPEQAKSVLEKLRVLPAAVRLAPSPIATEYPQSRLSQRYGIQMLSVLDRPLSGTDAIVKELFDKIVGFALLLTLAPVLLLIAVAIKLDSPGPAFFVQRRYGFNNQLILVWKFRTMHVSDRDDDADRLTSRNDPRVTRVGAVLRRTSLDELPQLFNVVAGEMSLIGPRPHALHAKAGGKLYEHAVLQYAARHRVKPGITGWAQVNGWRGETDTEEKILKRVQHDLYYIENWSFWLDMKILGLTVLAVLSGRNSY